MPAERRAAGGLLVLLLLSLTARAEEAWPVRSLLVLLAQAAPPTVRFVEERHLEQLTEPLQSAGTLTFVPPSRLERHVLDPREEVWTIDGDQVAVATAPGERQTALLSDQPPLAVLIAGLRAILTADAETLERHFTIGLDGGPAAWTLHLTPRREDLRGAIREIRIAGAGARIATIETIESSGDRSILHLSDGG